MINAQASQTAAWGWLEEEMEKQALGRRPATFSSPGLRSCLPNSQFSLGGGTCACLEHLPRHSHFGKGMLMGSYSARPLWPFVFPTGSRREKSYWPNYSEVSEHPENLALLGT